MLVGSFPVPNNIQIQAVEIVGQAMHTDDMKSFDMENIHERSTLVMQGVGHRCREMNCNDD